MRKQSMSLMLAALMVGGSLAGCSGWNPVFQGHHEEHGL